MRNSYELRICLRKIIFFYYNYNSFCIIICTDYLSAIGTYSRASEIFLYAGRMIRRP